MSWGMVRVGKEYPAVRGHEQRRWIVGVVGDHLGYLLTKAQHEGSNTGGRRIRPSCATVGGTAMPKKASTTNGGRDAGSHQDAEIHGPRSLVLGRRKPSSA